MADEQIIYLSPEEDVTNVHERLEHIPARRILLVVPPQTHLRSLTSWRVLRSYARELDKEVLVVTSDRQIRSVAKEAQFRVANSLESPPTSKGRGGSSPSRSGLERLASLRDQSNRGGRSGQRTRQTQRPAQNPGTGAPSDMARPQTPPPRSPLPPSQSTDELNMFAPNEMEENTDLGRPSSSFGGPEEPYGSSYDFRLPPSSFIHPLEEEPEQEDEDLDSFHYNYQQSQKIFQAAQQKDEPEKEVGAGETDDTDRMVAPSGDEQISSSMGNSSEQAQWPPSPVVPVDPFAQMDDFQPLPLSEQRGAAMTPIHEFDDGEEVADISQYPTVEIQGHGEIEDLGDVGMDDLPPFEEPPGSSPTWEEEQEQEDEGEPGEELPSIEDQPTRVIPPALGLPDAVTGSQSSRVSPTNPLTGNRGLPTGPMSRQREPEAVALPPATRRRSTPLSTPTTSPRPTGKTAQKTKRPAATQTQRKPVSVSRSQRKREINWVTPAVIIVAFLLIGIIIFLTPSADVSVALAAKSYSWPVVVTASSTSKQDVTLRTVPLRTANFTTTITATGNASGVNSTVGTAPATGIVQFTNNSTKQITIPTGTVVSTLNNVFFVTTAEVVVGSNGGVNIVPVQAQTPGANGNVPAGSITVVPPITITQLEQVKDNSGITVKLSVTNPNSTTGGGGASKQATTVTPKDVSTLQSSINIQLQAGLRTWITLQEQQQESVLAQPVQTNQLSKYETTKATPAAGQVASNGTFSETVSINMPVQFVRKSDLQAQASTLYAQLSSESKVPKGFTKPPTGYALVPGEEIQLKPAACASSSKSSTANASTLCFTAIAPVALPISAQEVQNLVTGKPVQTVKESLPNSKNGLAGVKSVNVNVSPSFWPWMPFWTQRISVHFTVAT